MFLNDRERAETIRACRFCPMCYAGDRLAGVVARESYAPRGRAAILFAMERGLLPADATVADIMYTTLNDGLLRQWCVGNFDHEELVLDARAKLFAGGLAPAGVVRHLETARAALGGESDAAAMLGEAGARVEARAEVLLLTGCLGHGEANAARAEAIRFARLLNMARVPFSVLPVRTSCGWPFYQGGDLDGARRCSVELADAIRKSGASTVVTLDADCLRMLQTRIRRFGGDLGAARAVHVTALLAGWLEEGRLRARKAVAARVTYQDPCSLARYCDELESPRRVLGHVVEGPLLEMEKHGKWSNCCGGGGLLGVHRPDLAAAVAARRLEDAAATGAEILVTACAGCTGVLGQAQGAGAGGPRVVSLSTLVAEAVGVG
jgi:Fe-S oxidoreductase